MTISFEWTDEHKIIREAVRDFARTEVAPKIPEMDINQEYDRKILEKMGELGFLGVSIPQKYGGGGMDYISTAIVSEELEYVDTALRVAISVHNGLNSMGIYQWGTEEQKMKYLKPQAEGKKLAAYGLTEPNAGSDVAAMESTAKKDGDNYILNGSKIWISLAATADNILVFAKTDSSKGHRGISAFLIESGYKGVSSGSHKNKLGVRAGNTGFLNFDDVVIPQENLLGEEGEGFKIAMSCLDNGRFTVAAGSVGLAKASRDAAVKYAQERTSFNKKISEHQLVQRLIAHMNQGIEAAELLVLKAGWLKNIGRRNSRETAMAKWYATNVASQAADDAIQVHGAYGFSAEYPVERFWRNARGARIYEGTDQIQEIIQGQYAFGFRQDKPLRKDLPPYNPDE
ncbi:MAG: acyl-CoA dehydrogenase family protein [Candidatus Heimdallarchaeota archaeon]|nr:acyl-CoA dehydrogenase family protein [Candidatus Heimdallarchaeota archaeon]